MSELGKQEEQPPPRGPEATRAHRRAIPSVDHSRPLVPDTHLQYGNNSGGTGTTRGHQRQISETPYAAIPKHMRTSSVQDPFGNHREPLVSAAWQSASSPFLFPGTPDLDNLIGFQPQEPGSHQMPFHQTPQLGQGMFTVPGQLHPDQRVLSHNGTPIVMDQGAMAQFQGLLGGSPGPLIQIYSPKPKAAPSKFSGLTPLLNFSPYPDHHQDHHPPPGPILTPVLGDSGGPKSEKRHLCGPEIDLVKGSGDPYSPTKKPRLESQVPGEPSDQCTVCMADDSAMDVPGDDYSPQALNHMWTEQDVEEMLGLLEQAERFKWRYVSDQFYNQYQKRIPGIACSKKYRDLFGSPESSSLLGSSLFYVAFRAGWQVINSQNNVLLRDSGSDHDDTLKEEDSC